MAKKFYSIENCRRRISANGIVFAINSVHHFGGTWYGEYSTDNPNEQAALELLSKSGVREVTEAEHAELLKKKLHLSERSQAIRPVLPDQLPMQVADRAGRLVGEAPSSDVAQVVEVKTEAAKTPAPSQPAEVAELIPATPADAIQLGRVPTVAHLEKSAQRQRK